MLHHHLLSNNHRLKHYNLAMWMLFVNPSLASSTDQKRQEKVNLWRTHFQSQRKYMNYPEHSSKINYWEVNVKNVAPHLFVCVTTLWPVALYIIFTKQCWMMLNLRTSGPLTLGMSKVCTLSKPFFSISLMRSQHNPVSVHMLDEVQYICWN